MGALCELRRRREVICLMRVGLARVRRKIVGMCTPPKCVDGRTRPSAYARPPTSRTLSSATKGSRRPAPPLPLPGKVLTQARSVATARQTCSNALAPSQSSPTSAWRLCSAGREPLDGRPAFSLVGPPIPIKLPMSIRTGLATLPRRGCRPHAARTGIGRRRRAGLDAESGRVGASGGLDLGWTVSSCVS